VHKSWCWVRRLVIITHPPSQIADHLTGCIPLVQQIFNAEMKAMGAEVKNYRTFIYIVHPLSSN